MMLEWHRLRAYPSANPSTAPSRASGWLPPAHPQIGNTLRKLSLRERCHGGDGIVGSQLRRHLPCAQQPAGWHTAGSQVVAQLCRHIPPCLRLMSSGCHDGRTSKGVRRYPHSPLHALVLDDRSACRAPFTPPPLNNTLHRACSISVC